MVEHSTIAGNTVTANASLKTGYGIQRRGADARAGDILLTAGTVLGPAQLAVAAAAGVAAPRVRKPRIAILTTGDELIDDLSQPLPPGKIRNSNRPMLVALAAATGADVLDLGACRDESAPLRAILQRALAEADLLLVSGGMSMGTRDLVPPMLKELGVSLHVEKVRIKPGKPFILGSATINGCPAYVAGLPGNPVSGFVTFQRFVLPMLARMRATPLPQLQQAALSIPLPANGDREFYQPCILSRQPDGSLRAELLKWKGSADLFTLGRANGLLVQRPDDPGLPINAAAPVLPF
jgi:molybdopterin molybdotransferase